MQDISGSMFGWCSGRRFAPWRLIALGGAVDPAQLIVRPIAESGSPEIARSDPKDDLHKADHSTRPGSMFATVFDLSLQS